MVGRSLLRWDVWVNCEPNTVAVSALELANGSALQEIQHVVALHIPFAAGAERYGGQRLRVAAKDGSGAVDRRGQHRRCLLNGDVVVGHRTSPGNSRNESSRGLKKSPAIRAGGCNGVVLQSYYSLHL